MNRRNLLKTLALGAIGVSTGTLSAEANQPRPGLLRRSIAPQAGRTPTMRSLRLGLADLHFSDADPEAWAQHAVERQLRAVNAPGVDLNDKDRINAIVAAVEKRNLVIAEVGRWVNLLDADPVRRANNLQFITDGLAIADELDARCCVTIAGSFNEVHWAGQHPRNVTREHFDITVENARKIIDAVKPRRTKFTYEPVGWMTPDTADSYLRLIRAVNRREFAVHLDIANTINTPDKYWNNTRLINETFDKLGQWIVGAHFKDLRWVNAPNIHFQQQVVGEGSIDFGTYLTRMAQLPFEAPLIIEHMHNADEYNRSRDHLFKVGESVGVSFG